MTDNETSIYELKQIVKRFSEIRDWDQFHNAKELAIGISTEANELLQLFRFKTEEQIDNMFKKTKSRKNIESELADVFHFVLRFSQRYNIDLETALKNKMFEVNTKYPVEKVKGINLKYDEYEN